MSRWTLFVIASSLIGCHGGGAGDEPAPAPVSEAPLQTPAPSPAPESDRAAYMYDTDLALAQEFETLIESWGWTVDLIHVLNAHLVTAQYRVILLGPDSGYQYTWGNSAQVGYLNGLGRPFLAIGPGGSSFYSELGLSADYGSGMFGTTKDMSKQDASHPVFSSPNAIGADPVDLGNGQWMGMYLGSLDASVTVLGRSTVWTNHASLTFEDGRYFYWGYYAAPGTWSAIGKQLFQNVLAFLRGLPQ